MLLALEDTGKQSAALTLDDSSSQQSSFALKHLLALQVGCGTPMHACLPLQLLASRIALE